MRRLVVWGLSFVAGVFLSVAVYDAGKRDIIRKCHKFRAFLYEEKTWVCMTPEQYWSGFREDKEAEPEEHGRVGRVDL